MTNKILLPEEVTFIDPLSPFIFITILETLFDALTADLNGIMVGSSRITHTVAADDIVIAVSNQEDLQTGIKLIDQYCKASGSNLNMNKSFGIALGEPLKLPSNGFKEKHTTWVLSSVTTKLKMKGTLRTAL